MTGKERAERAEADTPHLRDDQVFLGALGLSLVLNLGLGAVLYAVDPGSVVIDQATAVPRSTLVAFEDELPFPELAAAAEADGAWSAGGEAGSGSEATEVAGSPGGGDGTDAAEGDPGGSGGDGGDAAAASAEEAFLAAFGDAGTGSSGGGGGAGDVAVRAGDGTDAGSGGQGAPRSSIGGDGGAGGGGNRPLAAGGSLAGRMGATGSGLGGSGGSGGGIQRSGRVRVSAPDAGGANAGSSGPGAEVFERIGRRVQENAAQIRFCYEEEGLKVNPQLGGTVRVEFDVSGGGVADARIGGGLEGEGAEATESCILRVLRAWRFPDVEESVTVPFTFVLSR